MLERIIELIFPKFCLSCAKAGSYLCTECTNLVKKYEQAFCPECGRAAIDGYTHPKCLSRGSLDGLGCLFEYKDPLRKILQIIKYRFSFKLAEDLAPLFSELALPGQLNGHTLVPLPLSKGRENWRGFNQADLLGKFLAASLGLKISKGELLERTKFNRQQTGLTLKEREKNLQGAFQVVKGQNLSGAKLVLFDDVWTTGTTLREAAKVLKRAGAERVWGLCLATSHRVY